MGGAAPRWGVFGVLTSLVVGCPPQEWVDAGSSSPDKVKATSFFALQEMQEKEKGELPPLLVHILFKRTRRADDFWYGVCACAAKAEEQAKAQVVVVDDRYSVCPVCGCVSCWFLLVHWLWLALAHFQLPFPPHPPPARNLEKALMMNWMTGCMFMQFDWEMGALCTLLVLEPCKTTASKVNTDSAAQLQSKRFLSKDRLRADFRFSAFLFVPDTGYLCITDAHTTYTHAP